MRTGLTSALVAILVVALAVSFSRVPEALSRMESFRVTGIRLEGNRFLTHREVVNTLGIPASASVWNDLGAWEDRLRTHLLVEDVRIRRRLPGTLVMEVTEITPVALVPNPTLEPMDCSGRLLPIDPAQHRLDLPLVSLEDRGKVVTLSAAERRLVAGEIARISRHDPEFLARISEVTLYPRGDLRARIWRRNPEEQIWDRPVNIHFHPDLPARRIHEGLKVLEDALVRFDGAGISGLDLRYEDQVVVRLSRAKEG